MRDARRAASERRPSAPDGCVARRPGRSLPSCRWRPCRTSTRRQSPSWPRACATTSRRRSRRPTRRDPRRARGAAGRGPRADRGQPGGRQDRPGPGAGPLDRRRVRARAVHRRPAAGRRGGHQRLQPARGQVRVPARAGVRERGAGRRDQPRVAEDAVGPARVHAGAPRDRGQAHPRPGPAVHRARHPEPDRVRGHLPAARGAARPLHGARVARLPVGRRREGHARRALRSRPRARPRGRSTGVAEVLAAQEAVAARARQRRPAPLHRLGARRHPRATRGSSWAPARAPG